MCVVRQQEPGACLLGMASRMTTTAGDDAEPEGRVSRAIGYEVRFIDSFSWIQKVTEMPSVHLDVWNSRLCDCTGCMRSPNRSLSNRTSEL